MQRFPETPAPGNMERKDRMRRLQGELIKQGLYVRPVYLNETLSEYAYFIVAVDDPDEITISQASCIIMENDMNPKFLYIDSISNDCIALKPVSGHYNTPICFPQMFVYKFDEKLFGELKEAYKKGDEELLKQLWAKAKRWEPDENSK